MLAELLETKAAFWGRDWGSPGQPTCYACVPSFHGGTFGGQRAWELWQGSAWLCSLAVAPVSSARAGLSPGSPDEASLEPEPEDEAGGAQGSVAGMGQRRANTTVLVCWCRHTSVSRADHSAAVEVRPGAPALLPPYSSTQLASAPQRGAWLVRPVGAPSEQMGARLESKQAAGSSWAPAGREVTWVPLCRLCQPWGQRRRAPA